MIVKPIERLFYKKYAYKVTLECSWRLWSLRHTSKPIGEAKKSVALLKALDGWAREQFQKRYDELEKVRELGFQTRIEQKFNFFFETKELAESFVKHVGTHIETFYKPVNDSHQELMFDDCKNRIRTQLFERKFRYKVTFSKPRIGKQTFSHEWCKEYFGNLKIAPGENRWDYRVNWRTEVLYLNDKKDVMTIRLGLSEHIESIEFCVLVDEIKGP